MNIPADLWEAYQRTEYRIGAVILKVGEKSVGLNAEGKPWAYITAWNPGSEFLRESINRSRQEALESKLHEEGFACQRGVARDPLGQWPDEEGILVFGIDRQRAVELGREFGQSAILVGVGDSVVELVVTEL